MTCLSPFRAPALGSGPGSEAKAATRLAASAEWRLVALGSLGALLMALPGFRYRIDVTRCAAWPAPGENIAYAGIYLVALTLITVAWFGVLRRAGEPDGPSVRRVLAYGALINGCALLAPPFLSDDPLFYAATSRVLAVFGQSPYVPLCQTLPKGDPFLTILVPNWQCGTSAYFPGFQALAWAVGKLGGNSVALHLRLYQLLGAGIMLLTAWVTAGALGPTRVRPALGAALLALNPLTVVEGSIGAHNDVLLALGCALFVYSVTHKRPALALLCLLASLAVKASAVLLIGMYMLYLMLGFLRQRWPQLNRWLPWLAGGTLLLSLSVISIIHYRVQQMKMFTSLVGSPADPWDYCTRSIECLPRVILRWILHMPTAAWIVGLVFRVLGGLWLALCAWRARSQPLAWLGTGLGLYYLYLHGWAQTWYLLSMLPLLPFASAAVRPALVAVCVSGCAYYAGVLIGGCVTGNIPRGVVDLVEGLVTVVPPSVALWRYRNQADV